MLRIRLARVGKRGKPSYRIVVAESSAPRDGAYVEWIGNYDPMVKPPAVALKADRAKEWLRQGAQPSDAVRRIFGWNGIIPQTPSLGLTQESAVESTAADAPSAVAVGPAEAGASPATGQGMQDASTGEASLDERAD